MLVPVTAGIVTMDRDRTDGKANENTPQVNIELSLSLSLSLCERHKFYVAPVTILESACNSDCGIFLFKVIPYVRISYYCL